MKLRFLTLSAIISLAAGAFALETAEGYSIECYVPDVELDQEGKGTVEVYLNTTDPTINTFMMDVYLPEGVTMDKNARGNYKITFNTADGVIESQGGGGTENTNADGTKFVRIVATSVTADYILTGDNMIFSFGITAEPTYTKTENGKMESVDFADDWHDNWLPDIDFEIAPYSAPTDLNGVSVDQTTGADSYNLQGMKVSRASATPGIYIINGKKVLVK